MTIAAAGVDGRRPRELEPEVGGAREASHRDQHGVGVEGRAVEQRGAQRAAGALEPRHVGREAQVDAARAHGVGEREPHLAVEAAQEELAAVELRHLAAEAVGDRRELGRDVAAADDHDALGALGKMEHVIGGDRELPAGELVPEGAATGRDQHVVGLDGAIADRERVRRGEARAALEAPRRAASSSSRR